MKYTWYMFKQDKPITRCIDCPFLTDNYDCELNPLSDKIDDMDEQFAQCPLIPIEGRVEQ